MSEALITANPASPAGDKPTAVRGANKADGSGKAIAVLLGPATLLILATNIVPGVVGFYTSLRDVFFFSDEGFVGLAHYQRLFTSPTGLEAIGRSLQFTFLSLTLGLTFAFATALVVHRLGQRGRLLMTALLVPWAMSPIVVAILWKWILAPFDGGLLAGILQFVGAGPVSLLSDTRGAMAAIVGVAVWRTFAFASLVLLAGLAQIPDDLYKSAAIDGLTRRESFSRITLPLMSPSILIVLAVLTISFFNEVQVIIGLTGGGPLRYTTTLSYHLYQVGFVELNQGYGNAVAVLMFTINLGLILLYIKVLGVRRKGSSNG